MGRPRLFHPPRFHYSCIQRVGAGVPTICMAFGNLLFVMARWILYVTCLRPHRIVGHLNNLFRGPFNIGGRAPAILMNNLFTGPIIIAG